MHPSFWQKGGGTSIKCPQDREQWQLLIYSKCYNLNSLLFVSCFRLVQLKLCVFMAWQFHSQGIPRETLSHVCTETHRKKFMVANGLQIKTIKYLSTAKQIMFRILYSYSGLLGRNKNKLQLQISMQMNFTNIVRKRESIKYYIKYNLIIFT